MILSENMVPEWPHTSPNRLIALFFVVVIAMRETDCWKKNFFNLPRCYQEESCSSRKGKKWAEDKIGCCELLMEKEYFFKQTGGMGIGKYGRRMW